LSTVEIIAQIFGIFGLIFMVYSFQEKNNKRLFINQGISGLMFFLNFILIGAVSAALFNLTNLIRGMIFSKPKHKAWHLILIEALYLSCFVYSVVLTIGSPFQIFLSSLTYLSLVVMTVFMWQNNGRYIRYVQVGLSSPAWIIHNIFNFSLGGLICEILSMASVIVSFIRYGKDGFEK